MLRAIVICIAVCALSVSAFAQGNLVGKWGGSFKISSSGGGTVGMELEITGVESNVVKGVAKIFGRNCGGEYQLVGKLDGAKLEMGAIESGGGARDCKPEFLLTMEGGRMTGKYGNNDIVFNKK